MAFTLDPEIAAALAAQAEAGDNPTPPPVGDALALRAFIGPALSSAFARLPSTPGVEMTQYSVQAEDGAQIALYWYTSPGATPGPAVIYVHGGGMICGSAADYDPLVRHYVGITGTPFLLVGYRLAPEYRELGLGSDVVRALQWLGAEADQLGVDPRRIALMGDSGGGGVAAAAAIRARDQGTPLARQILVYPMLDDRNISPDPLLAATALWTYESNETAWRAVLGDRFGTNEVSPYLAPARLSDFSGLAPAFIEVGELDIFRDEALDYAQRLLAAGVSCELRLHPGAPHGYDWLDHRSSLSGRAVADRVRVIRAL